MLDGGPSRTSQQLDRRTAARRPEPVRRGPEESQPAEAPVSRPVHRSPSPQPEDRKSSFLGRFLKPLLVALVVLALIVSGWMVWSSNRGFGSTIDPNKYQAVFFNNGQVYFGKLKMTSSDSMVLSKVYYLKSPAGETGTNNPQGSSDNSEDGNVQLIKLGNEIHGPEDAMEISRDQVLFFENLKNSGQVAKLMKEYKANN